MADPVEALHFPVQVVYAPAPPAMPLLETLIVAPNTTIAEVLRQSRITATLPDLDLSACKVGIWGKIVECEAIVPAHSRIEIYRPLIADPKDARRRRAASKTR
ncbi:MAG: RnfH family protein [Pseudomonadota bacterium]